MSKALSEMDESRGPTDNSTLDELDEIYQTSIPVSLNILIKKGRWQLFVQDKLEGKFHASSTDLFH